MAERLIEDAGRGVTAVSALERALTQCCGQEVRGTLFFRPPFIFGMLYFVPRLLNIAFLLM